MYITDIPWFCIQHNNIKSIKFNENACLIYGDYNKSVRVTKKGKEMQGKNVKQYPSDANNTHTHTHM